MRLLFPTFLAALFCLAALPVQAQSGSSSCKRELAAANLKMRQSLALVRAAASAASKQRCDAYFKHLDLVGEIRESFARCQDGEAHAQSLRAADDVRDETEKVIERHCPPTPGMVRVNMVWVKRLSAEELPKPLAAAHRCETLPRMRYTNEPFDGGRIIMAGCKGNGSASDFERAGRNVSAQAVAEEQAAIYLALDSTGRGAKRLTLPILLPDGRTGATDLIPAQGAIAQKRDLLVGNWAPANGDVCRIHAEWKFANGKPALVLWQEVVDCAKPGAPDYRTILDQR